MSKFYNHPIEDPQPERDCPVCGSQMYHFTMPAPTKKEKDQEYYSCKRCETIEKHSPLLYNWILDALERVKAT